MTDEVRQLAKELFVAMYVKSHEKPVSIRVVASMAIAHAGVFAEECVKRVEEDNEERVSRASKTD